MRCGLRLRVVGQLDRRWTGSTSRGSGGGRGFRRLRCWSSTPVAGSRVAVSTATAAAAAAAVRRWRRVRVVRAVGRARRSADLLPSHALCDLLDCRLLRFVSVREGRREVHRALVIMMQVLLPHIFEIPFVTETLPGQLLVPGIRLRQCRAAAAQLCHVRLRSLPTSPQSPLEPLQIRTPAPRTAFIATVSCCPPTNKVAPPRCRTPRPMGTLS